MSEVEQALRIENDRLRDRIDELERALGTKVRFPFAWGLTRAEAVILGTLMARGSATRDDLITAVGGGADYVDRQIDSHVKRMRRKMARLGVEISTIYGHGYYLTPEMKSHVRQLVADANAPECMT